MSKKRSFAKQSTSAWKKYYLGRGESILTRYNKLVLNSFQRHIYHTLEKYVKEILSRKEEVSILSAGAGLDFIAYKLKKKFEDRVAITIFDVSEECLLLNKSLFGPRFRFVKGDIFKFSFRQKFDLVYNTGLLEHFSEFEKKKILDWTKKTLDKGGYYVTLNPSRKGRLYIRCMRIAKQRGIWPYGREIPIASLKKFSNRELILVSEKDVVGFAQINFLAYYNKFLYFLLLPSLFLFDILRLDFIDTIFGKLMGYYGLLSVFKRTR